MSLTNLNQINLGGWRGDPNVTVHISREIEKASWEESKFLPLLGSGENRGIKAVKAEKSQPISPRLKTALQGRGVIGNANLDTNLDKLEILSQVVYPRLVANATESEVKQYQAIKEIDFLKESIDSLTTWIEEKRDRFLFAALSNDITNCVICDKDKGFKDTSKEKTVNEATKKVQVDDTMNVKAIQRAILMAKTGQKFNGKPAFPIKPIKSTKTQEGGLNLSYHSYVILLDSYQIQQLRSDPEWKEMQDKSPRDETHRIFTGLAGMIDGCPIIDMGTWSTLSPGMINSTVSDSEFIDNINPENFKTITPPSAYASDKTPLSIGYLIGASALIMAGDSKVNFYINEAADMGRKIQCAVDRLMAIAKGRFESHADGFLSPYANTDYAVIGIFSSLQ